MNLIIYILIIMIFYDFYLHLVELFYGDQEKSMHLKYYWPPAKIFKNASKNFYNIFWTSYWGVSFALLVLYIILK